MGTLVPFKHRRSHVTAPALFSKPKSAGSADLPSCARRSANIFDLLDGMRPRARQLLTAGVLTPAKAAAAAVPPTALITSSTVRSSMTPNSSQSVNMSTVHEMAIVTNCELGPNRAVSRTLRDVAKRLEATQRALGVSAADLCRRTGIRPNAWSQFLNPKSKRRITLEAAYRLRDEYGLTLDWIYDGDPSGLSERLAQALRKAEAA
jgi:hypothetical protein